MYEENEFEFGRMTIFLVLHISTATASHRSKWVRVASGRILVKIDVFLHSRRIYLRFVLKTNPTAWTDP